MRWVRPALVALLMATGAASVAGQEASRLDAEAAAGTVCVAYAVVTTDGDVPTGDLDRTMDVLEARLADVGITDARLTIDDLGTISVALPAADEAALRALFGAVGELTFVPVPTPALAVELRPQAPLPEAMAGIEPILSGADIDGAELTTEPSLDLRVIDLRLGEAGAASLDEHASGHVGEGLAIVLDGVVLSVPIIRAASFDGRVRIVPDLPEADLERLVALIRSGPLPLVLREVDVGVCG